MRTWSVSITSREFEVNFSKEDREKSEQELSEDNKVRLEATKLKKATFSEYKVKVIRSKLWYGVKDLVTRNTHVKYESPISQGSQFMTKVKVFEK